MSGNKIIDDYYLKYSNEKNKNEEEKNATKKVSLKGKIKVKKSNKVDTESKIDKKNEEKKEEEKIELKKEVKIKSVKKISSSETLSESKVEIKKSRSKKEVLKNNKSDEKLRNIKKVEKSPTCETNTPKSISLKEEKKETESQNSDKVFSFKYTQKSFKDNEKSSNKNNFSKKVVRKKLSSKDDEYFDENKRNKFFKKDRTTKYKNSFFVQDEENDIVFVRSKSNKIKKEEKKIEDIKQDLVLKTGETVIVGDVLSVKELSEKIGVPLPKLIQEFMKNGMMVNLNSKVDFDTASIISDNFGIKLEKDSSFGFSIEDLMEGKLQTLLGNEENDKLKKRPPVVSIMGHVDHGKTSLLDYIRKTKVASKEAGGITQSIGAYQIEYNGEKITFLDTPGHEAFTIMRARGAKLTDIAVLVVAADEGVKPQTIESINHAREAGIPIIVAINKIDKEGANPDNVKTQLRSNGLLAEDWGGDVPMVLVSALKGTGINDLLDVILLVADIHEFKANPDRLGIATVIESHLDPKLGPVSTVLVNAGTINKGDCIVCKQAYGKIRILKNHLLKNIDKASISEPVLIVGLNEVMQGGDIVQVVSDIEKARQKALEFQDFIQSKSRQSVSSIDILMSKIKSGSLKNLKIVLKADTNGALEAIKQALQKLSTNDISIQIIHAGVGNITEGDALMCQSSQAILVGYNVDLLQTSKKIVEDAKIEYISSPIIYHITEKIEKIITGMFDPEEKEIDIGLAEVGGIFYEGKDFKIVGLKLFQDSIIKLNANVRIIRGKQMIGKGFIENLKSGVVDVNELNGPIECGIKLKTDVKIELKDKLEIYVLEKVNK